MNEVKSGTKEHPAPATSGAHHKLGMGPIDAAGVGIPYELSDYDNAQRIYWNYRDELKFDRRTKVWRKYDERRGIWKADEGRVQITDAAATTAKAIFREAEAMNKNADAMQYAKWALASQSKAKLDAAIALAERLGGFSPPADAWDGDREKICTLNCVLAPRTGDTFNHNPTFLMTRSCAAPYEPDARSETWEKCLAEWLAPLEVAAAQRLGGYSLTGSTSEQVFMLAYGPEATGKSTFVEAMRAAIGGYAFAADWSSFIKREFVDGQAASPDIARLDGPRMVVASETDEGRELAAGLIKKLTGGDRILARNLYCDPYEFAPQFKLWLVANHCPYISADDGGVWRRLVRMPFVRTIPKAQRNKSIMEELTDPALSGSAILKWMVDGCMEWDAGGLQIPDSIEQSTADLRKEMDHFETFCEEELMFAGANGLTVYAFSMTKGELRGKYVGWMAKNRLKGELGPRRFAEKMKSKGAEDDTNSSGQRIWWGVSPK